MDIMIIQYILDTLLPVHILSIVYLKHILKVVKHQTDLLKFRPQRGIGLMQFL